MTVKMRDFVKRGEGELQVEEECFFLNGFSCPAHNVNFRVPFKSEKERKELWEKFEKPLLSKMYLPRTPEHWLSPFCLPDENQLRPSESFNQGKEKKRILNDATIIKNGDHRIFDKQPLLETDLEYLSRLNLLTDEDREYIQTEDFQKTEDKALKFRNYILRGQ